MSASSSAIRRLHLLQSRSQPLSTRSTRATRPTAAAAASPTAQQHRQNGKPYDDSYLLAQRVTLLSTRNQLDSAIDLVKQSPAQVANVVCWNLLVHACLQHGQYKRAYDVWMDMKRRGVKPTARSYGTFFAGFAKLRGATATATAISGSVLARVQTVYAQWIVHAHRVIERQATRRSSILDDDHDNTQLSDRLQDLTALPTNYYLTFLANTSQLDLMLSTFNSMPATGPLAPTTVTNSIVLTALRATCADNPQHFTAAMELWSKMRDELDPADIDTKTVSVVISICRDVVQRTQRPQDLQIGLQAARDFYGLVEPAAEPQLVSGSLAHPKVQMDPGALANVLSLALAMHQHNLVVRWFDQVRDYPDRFGLDAIDHHPCDLVFVALANKKDAEAAEDLLQWMLRSPSSAIKPALSTYTNALQVCWRAADLNRAYRVLSLMSGREIKPRRAASSASASSPELSTSKSASESLDSDSTGSSSSSSTLAFKSTAKTETTMKPDDRVLSTFLQTALATRDRGHIYRALCLLDPAAESTASAPASFARPASHFPSSSSGASERTTTSPGKGKDKDKRQPRLSATQATHAAYWQFRLAESLSRCLERVLQTEPAASSSSAPGKLDHRDGRDGGHLSPARRTYLRSWREAIETWLAEREGRERMRAKRLGLPRSEDHHHHHHHRGAATGGDGDDRGGGGGGRGPGDARRGRRVVVFDRDVGIGKEEETMRGRWERGGYQIRPRANVDGDDGSGSGGGRRHEAVRGRGVNGVNESEGDERVLPRYTRYDGGARMTTQHDHVEEDEGWEDDAAGEDEGGVAGGRGGGRRSRLKVFFEAGDGGSGERASSTRRGRYRSSSEDTRGDGDERWTTRARSRARRGADGGDAEVAEWPPRARRRPAPGRRDGSGSRERERERGWQTERYIGDGERSERRDDGAGGGQSSWSE